MNFKITGKLGLDGVTYIDRSGQPKKRKQSPSKAFVASDAWKEVRAKAIALYGAVCMKCGSQDKIQVDHVKPKSRFPDLSLDISNLQILCWGCNKDKGFYKYDDYRPQVGKSLPCSSGCTN